MMKKEYFVLPLVLLFLICSCDSSLDFSLENAGENKDELEKVLEHFEHDPNPLKYEAAKFLIENMPYQYTFKGDAVERFNKLYLNTSKKTLMILMLPCHRYMILQQLRRRSLSRR